MADNTHAMEQARARFEHIAELMAKYKESQSDEVLQELQEMPLSVELRSDWQGYGEELSPSEFSILMCTGGPAVRIHGGIDEHGQPYDAEIEGQDWFTRWESLSLDPEQAETLLEFAQLIIPS